MALIRKLSDANIVIHVDVAHISHREPQLWSVVVELDKMRDVQLPLRIFSSGDAEARCLGFTTGHRPCALQALRSANDASR